jgi:hypothetical protein
VIQPRPIDFIPGNKLSYATTRIEVLCNGHIIGHGTGFVLKFATQYGLVTNWHVVSGRNPINGTLISKYAAIPDEIKCHVCVVWDVWKDEHHSTTMYFKPLNLHLRSGKGDVWRESERNGYRNDVVMIPLDGVVEELKEEKSSLAHIDASKFTFKRGTNPHLRNIDHMKYSIENFNYYYPAVGKDVFILGYPKGIDIGGVFPIWKRGSIASEPQAKLTSNGFTYDNLIYVDALTKEGMSGAPVIALANRGEIFVTDDGVLVTIDKPEPHFVGVYAGREGVTAEEYEFSIGRIWKAHTVTELFHLNTQRTTK